MQTNRLQTIDLSTLPENAQQELYDFFLFLQQRHLPDNRAQSGEKRKNISITDNAKITGKFKKFRGIATAKMSTDEIMNLTRER